jgi:MFS family permease
MPVLLLGRILGGLSTSLLFTAFESWMVSEHRKQGFPEELLAGTFSVASAGNGLMAIIAGLLAQRAAGKEHSYRLPFSFLYIRTCL